MIRTRVGYAGGLQADPDYRHIGDHTETVQVVYDPQRITFDQLLDIFWQSHNPASQSYSRQYLHAVFYHDERQQQSALASLSAVEEKTGHAVKTRVEPLRSFTLAEAYHQKYLLKQNPELKKEMTRFYPLHQDFIDSTAVARLNGYVGGYGTLEQLEREVDGLGLSEAGKKKLNEVVNRRLKGGRF